MFKIIKYIDQKYGGYQEYIEPYWPYINRKVCTIGNKYFILIPIGNILGDIGEILDCPFKYWGILGYIGKYIGSTIGPRCTFLSI